MTSLMRNYEAMSEPAQALCKAMADAARNVLFEAGVWPLNNDEAARFDEACAVYFMASMKTENNLRELAKQMRQELGFE